MITNCLLNTFTRNGSGISSLSLKYLTIQYITREYIHLMLFIKIMVPVDLALGIPHSSSIVAVMVGNYWSVILCDIPQIVKPDMKHNWTKFNRNYMDVWKSNSVAIWYMIYWSLK